jgi:hypothetical protein
MYQSLIGIPFTAGDPEEWEDSGVALILQNLAIS